MSPLTSSGKPRIGVTGPDKGGLAAWYFTKLAIWRAGGKAHRITPSRSGSMHELAGLIIGGGADVDPQLYGEDKEEFIEEIKRERNILRSFLTLLVYPLLYLIRLLFTTKVSMYGDQGRDDLENRLLNEALTLDRPVLGICRGAQLINVRLGGTLYQDIRNFYVETPHITTVFPQKEICLVPGTRLARVLPVARCKVNALHYQAIKDLGEGLVVSAREIAPDIVQAVEHPTRFILGVQWHPEYLFREQHQQFLFQELIAAASKAVGKAEDNQPAA